VFDLPSLFATKLHALFFRRYVKGRDYYDLLWFLGKNVKPNLPLLNNAIRQTEGKGHEIKEGRWKHRLIGHLESVDFAMVRSEVERFLPDRGELRFLNPRSLQSLLRNYE
jgi:predicted nucleotidyltransferase component of viral defense system